MRIYRTIQQGFQGSQGANVRNKEVVIEGKRTQDLRKLIWSNPTNNRFHSEQLTKATRGGAGGLAWQSLERPEDNSAQQELSD